MSDDNHGRLWRFMHSARALPGNKFPLTEPFGAKREFTKLFVRRAPAYAGRGGWIVWGRCMTVSAAVVTMLACENRPDYRYNGRTLYPGFRTRRAAVNAARQMVADLLAQHPAVHFDPGYN